MIVINEPKKERMNDFTKEELVWIKDQIDHILDDQFTDPEWVNDIPAKLQALIDNYCEHESDGYAYYKSGIKCTDFLTYACSESPCLLKCIKCSELFDDGRP